MEVQFSKNVNVQLYSIKGQLVAEKQNVSMLDMCALASGIYTLTLTNKRGEVQRSKGVKE
ncbi:MAG TPA: T9SS type A sorting domain-containing protein [Chitinophagales bacterium]